MFFLSLYPAWECLHIHPPWSSYDSGTWTQREQFYPWWKVDRIQRRGCLYSKLHHILEREFHFKLLFLQPLTTPIFGKEVVYDVPNDVFMEQKKFVKVGFSTENMRLYVGMIEEEIEQYINHDPSFATYQKNDVNEWGSFDATTIMQEITILTASRTLQGKEVRDSLNKGYAELFNDLDGGFTPLNFLFPNLPLESYRRRDRAHIKMSQFYVNLIQKRRKGNNDVRRLSSWPKISVFKKIFFIA